MNSSAFSILLESALRALVAGAAVWAGLRLLRVKNLLTEKAAWGLVLIAAVAMPVMTRWKQVPAWASIQLPSATWMKALHRAGPSAPVAAVAASQVAAQETVAPPVEELESDIAERAAPYFDFREPSYAEPASSPAPAAAPHPNAPVATGGWNVARRLMVIGWMAYFGVCAVLMIRLLWGLVSSFRLWAEANPVETPARLDFPASIRVRWSPRVTSPVNIGSGILLPEDYAEWDDEKLRVVLAHERSHIQQRDFYLQLLAGLYTALTWFSPLGWWLKHKLSELSEAISDHAGLNAATSPSAYAGLLLEFAALPRPTLNGVAMAHSKNLSQRIERLLNDASFRLAFAGGRRALLALVLPAALIAATAMVRVQAAVVPQQASSAQPAATGQSNPEPAQVYDATAQQAPEAAPTPEAAPVQAAPAAAPQAPGATPEAAPVPPAPAAPEAGAEAPMPPMPRMPREPHVHVEVRGPELARVYSYAYTGQDFDYNGSGEAYAIVGDAGSTPHFYGDWDDDRDAAVENARKIAHGHFILFRREDKSYVIDDPAIVSQFEEMDKARQDLSAQMKAMGKQMREVGEQAREEARKARETAANLPAPDLSKEIAALDASAASLKEKQGGMVSREQLQEIQREVMQIQRRVMEAEFKVNIGMNDAWKKFGEDQGKIGSQMGQLGAQMGRTMRENHEKMKSIIDESLKNGKARPVQ